MANVAFKLTREEVCGFEIERHFDVTIEDRFKFGNEVELKMEVADVNKFWLSHYQARLGTSF